jgi:hypothetical protein
MDTDKTPKRHCLICVHPWPILFLFLAGAAAAEIVNAAAKLGLVQ